MAKFAVIIPAAGSSTRFGDKNYKKTFIPLENKAVWLHSAERFMDRKDVCQTIVVIADEDREYFKSKFGATAAILGAEVVIGGKERSDSIQNALEALSSEAEFIAIHDAARPCIADAWISEVFTAAETSGAAILAIPVAGTLKKSADGQSIGETVSREHLWEAQTPQVFRRDLLEKAYAQRQGFNATDDAQLIERMGQSVRIVHGSSLNLKITRRDDLKLAACALRKLPKAKKTGGGNPLDDMLR